MFVPPAKTAPWMPPLRIGYTRVSQLSDTPAVRASGKLDAFYAFGTSEQLFDINRRPPVTAMRPLVCSRGLTVEELNRPNFEAQVRSSTQRVPSG
jgi:hypothetical protein